MPRVSVIVPNYNHAPFLKQRIDSILNQSFQDFELILLDDCSTDESRTVLSAYSSNSHVSHIVFNEQNSGSPFAQWNKGISLATGEWIWIAESDDWADEYFLETLLSEARLFPSVGLVFSKARTVNKAADVCAPLTTGKTFFFQGDFFLKEKLLFANAIYNVSSVLFRKDVTEQINHSLYKNMHLCGDWFFYSLLAECSDVLEVDKLLSYYRIHDSNTSSSAEHYGLTFLEGIVVLDYILSKNRISDFLYSRFWGFRMAEYQIRYNYSQEVINEILRKYSERHHMIVFFYYSHIVKLKVLRSLINVKNSFYL